MFARINTFKGDVARLAEGTALFRDTVVPEDEKHPGFGGALLLADRKAELSYAITFWETEDAMTATDELGREFAEKAAQALNLEVAIGHCEVPFSKFPTLVA